VLYPTAVKKIAGIKTNNFLIPKKYWKLILLAMYKQRWFKQSIIVLNNSALKGSLPKVAVTRDKYFSDIPTESLANSHFNILLLSNYWIYSS